MSKMRKTLLTILLATALTATGQKYVGGDISMLTKYEEAGVVYKDKDGNAVQPLPFFKEQGMNAMRVRLFVDPSRDSDKGVCQDLNYVKALGKRIKASTIATRGQTPASSGRPMLGRASTTHNSTNRFTPTQRTVCNS